MAEYAEVFLAGYAKANSKLSEQRHKEWALRHHVLPPLGDRELASLTKSDGELLIVQLQQRGLASKSIDNVLTIVKTLLYQAVDDELIVKNPWARVRKKKLRKRGGRSYWTRAESESFLTQAAPDAPHLSHGSDPASPQGRQLRGRHRAVPTPTAR